MAGATAGATKPWRRIRARRWDNLNANGIVPSPPKEKAAKRDPEVDSLAARRT